MQTIRKLRNREVINSLDIGGDEFEAAADDPFLETVSH